MDTADWVSRLVAAYGAVVATIAVVFTFLRLRRRMKINIIGLVGGSDTAIEDRTLEIEIINKGHQPIYIDEIGFTWTDGVNLRFPPSFVRIDKCLKEGTKQPFYFPLGPLTKSHTYKEIKYVWVRDETGGTRRSKIPQRIFR